MQQPEINNTVNIKKETLKGAAIGAGLGSVIGAPKIAFNFKYLTDYKSLLKKIIEGEIKRQEVS